MNLSCLVYDGQFFLCDYYVSKCMMPSILRSAQFLKVVECIPALNCKITDDKDTEGDLHFAQLRKLLKNPCSLQHCKFIIVQAAAWKTNETQNTIHYFFIN